MDDRLSGPRLVALAGIILLVGAGLSVIPATLAQDGGVETPTPSNDGGPNDPYDCSDFDSREEVNAVFDPTDDVSNLDDNDDGVACEGRFPPADDSGETTSTATATAIETATATETTASTTTEEETNAAAETEVTTETETEQPTASVNFENQSSNGTTVVVDSVTLSEDGFVAIHNSSLLDGNTLGSVVGVSEPLSAGTHENVEVTLFNVPGQNFSENMTLEESQTLIAMPHFDTNSNGVYEFITTNGSEDGPFTQNGSAVVDPASVTIEETDDQPTEPDDPEAQNNTAFYQVDFVVGEPIENLRGPNGTYENDQLIRFAHGSTEEPVTRLSEGEFITDENFAERIESQDITVENGTATTTFTVAKGESVTLTLASYEKIGSGWSPETEAQQGFVDAETQTFESGTHTLTVDLPDEDTNATD